MPKIICNVPAVLTGQVGSVVFDKGEGQTEDADMLAFFAAHPDRFEVLDGDETAESGEASPWSDLTDDELFEAYVTNVGEDGGAESRDDMVAALEALDSED